MKVLCSIPQDSKFAPSIRILDNDFRDLSTVNITLGVYWAAEAELKSVPAIQVRMVKLYEHLDELFPCVEIDLPMYPVVVPNHNGYCIKWVVDEATKSVISLDEYRVWDKTHRATWVDGKWVYVKADQPQSVVANR